VAKSHPTGVKKTLKLKYPTTPHYPQGHIVWDDNFCLSKHIAII